MQAQEFYCRLRMIIVPAPPGCTAGKLDIYVPKIKSNAAATTLGVRFSNTILIIISVRATRGDVFAA